MIASALDQLEEAGGKLLAASGGIGGVGVRVGSGAAVVSELQNIAALHGASLSVASLLVAASR